jgi:hypothetical protein
MSSRSTKIAGPAPVGDASLRWLCNEPVGSVSLANTGSKSSGALALAGSPLCGARHPWGVGVRWQGTSGQTASGAGAVSLATGAVTVTALVLATRINNQHQDAVSKNFDGAGSGGNCPVSLGQHSNNDGTIESQITTTNGVVNVTSSAPWVIVGGLAHLIAVTYDGATQKLWLDGQVAAQSAQTGTIVWGTGDWTLGNSTSTNANGSRFWYGWVGDVRVYERALSQTELQSLYTDTIWGWGGVIG